MDIKIIEQKNNSLMKREEVKVLVFDEKTPSFSESEEIISKRFNKPRENIDVRRIKGKFGRKSFLISAFVYQDPELKKKLTAKKKIKGEKPEQAEKVLGEAKSTGGGEKKTEEKEKKEDKIKEEAEQERHRANKEDKSKKTGENKS